MNPEPAIAAAAFLIGDPARTAMLMLLVDGQARPAGELAYAAGVTAQTASSHLGKLLDGGLLTVETEGRHRYYRLAGPHVVAALEHLASLTPPGPVRRKSLNPRAENLRFARGCYDHLAGHLSVAVTQAMEQRGLLVPMADKRFDVTPAGHEWFGRMGLDVSKIKPGRRGLAWQCLDWTERRHHLAGPLGTQFMNLLCAKGWLQRSSLSRAVHLTAKGWTAFKEQLGVAIGAE